MRFSAAIFVSTLAVVLAGCGPSPANIELRKERQQLLARVQELETLRQGDLARIKALEQQQDIPALVPQKKLERLYTAHGLSFGKLTGGYREPADSPHDTGVVVHVVPTDQEGQALKAAGRFRVTVFDLGMPDEPLVAERKFSIEQAHEAWYGRAMLYNYVLKVPFHVMPQHPRLRIRVEFIDELTGRTLISEKDVTVKL